MNRPRPRCPACRTPMKPLYQKGARGGFVRVPEAFWCGEDQKLAHGRTRSRFA